MPDLSSLDGITRVLLSMAFVLLAAFISRYQEADLEKELFIATARSFIQLLLIGYILQLVFDQQHPLWTLLILLVMILIAGRTSAQRSKKTPHALPIALGSIALGSALTILLLVGLGVFAFTPQNVIPIGGMVVGNAMTTATLVMTRLASDLREQRGEIEAMLALGADSRQASQRHLRRSLRSAMIPIIDTTKTVGLIKLPGAMTGMILAGASPIEAVQLQMIVMYMLVGADTFTGMTTTYLTYRQFFTSTHQLMA